MKSCHDSSVSQITNSEANFQHVISIQEAAKVNLLTPNEHYI